MGTFYKAAGLSCLFVTLFASTTHAETIIDDFDEVSQIAPTFDCGQGGELSPPCVAEVPSAIGGFRALKQERGENQIAVVVEEEGVGFLFVNQNGDRGGGVSVTWDAGGDGLGGVDLTAGGADRFRMLELVFQEENSFLETINLLVTDTGTGRSKFKVEYDTICSAISAPCELDFYDILFSDLKQFVDAGDPLADLTAVDSISLTFNTGNPNNPDLYVGAFRAVPGVAPGGSYIAKTKQCPVTGANLLPAGGNYNIEDIIVSSNGATDIELHWNPPKTTLLRLSLDANETVVSSFSNDDEAQEDQGLNLTCGGNATVSITITGIEKL